MSGRIAVLACLAAGLVAGAACDAAQDDAGTPAQVRSIEPGLYEVKVTTLSVAFDDAGTNAELQPLVGRSETSRECREGRPAILGGNALAGCTWSRIGDRGGTVDRVAQCPASPSGLANMLTMTGTRGSDRYDYRIRMTARRRDGRIVDDIVTREEGRRLGPCPAGSAQPGGS